MSVKNALIALILLIRDAVAWAKQRAAKRAADRAAADTAGEWMRRFGPKRKTGAPDPGKPDANG